VGERHRDELEAVGMRRERTEAELCLELGPELRIVVRPEGRPPLVRCLAERRGQILRDGVVGGLDVERQQPVGPGLEAHLEQLDGLGLLDAQTQLELERLSGQRGLGVDVALLLDLDVARITGIGGVLQVLLLDDQLVLAAWPVP